ncbi:hypothetical protein CHS0354_024895 [Potamilus streckersoni]|uniref:Hexosyltransferase n=1 Tax=Potamilus streckersoni TaxID=2493646 RepID=A0AAE0TFD6_9BIVA|nr:hypothetical protein CHS0354_024895 [Potamilus streckersoni]
MSICCVMRRRMYSLRFLIFTCVCFVCVTMLIQYLQFERVTTRFQLPTTCNESTSNTYEVLESSLLETLSPIGKANKEIPGDITNVSKPIYPLMLWNKYILNNPDLCNMVANISVLIVVKTDPLNFERRKIIRDTWSNYTYFQHFGVIRTLFLMGKVPKSEIQQNISREFDENLDILQGDFLDTYRNLTNKGVMGLRWITENCMQAKMIVEVDDDIVLNTYSLLQIVYPNYVNKIRYILCNIFMDGKAPIVRDVKHKWFVDDSELKRIGLLDKKIYPPYCSGFTVILATDLIPAMFGIAHVTQFFWVDDVYMYGLLPMKAGRIDYYSLASNYTFIYQDAMKCFSSTSTCNVLSVAETKPNEMRSVWNMIQSYHLKQQIPQKVK